MKRIITIVLLAASLAAFANERGNGGNAVVCRDSAGNIKSAELLDIYEGKALHKLSYQPFEGSIEEKATSIFEEIYGKNLNWGNRVLVENVQRSFNMLPEGVALEPISDSGHILVPKNCKVEQVANFYNLKDIFIVSDIYNEFSELDKLGLLLHEALFYMDRQGGVTNSRYVRRAVAKLLSSGFHAENVFEDIGEKDIYCSTVGKTLRTGFFIKDLGNNTWQFNFERINGHRVLSKKVGKRDFRELKFPAAIQDGGTLEMSYMTFETESKLDGMEVFAIGIGGKKMNLSWSGYDPEDSFSNQEFVCR